MTERKLYDSRTRDVFGRGLACGRYKVALNPLGTVPNAPLASAPDK